MQVERHLTERAVRLITLCLLGTSPIALATGAQAQTSGSVQEGAASTPAPSTEGTASSETDTGDIVVTGVRGAQRAAIAVKRQAAQIVDAVVAEDIGKLPDTTIADTLQRIPGVQITRSAGQGAGVNIRGIPQVQTTLNGEIFLGSQNLTSAQPTFVDVPPTLFSGVDIIKSPTAENLSGGIGGIIDLKTRRPFDLERGLTLATSLQGDYGARTKEWSKQASALLGFRGSTIAGLVSVGYSDEKLANYQMGTGNSFSKIGDTDVGFDLRGDGSLGSAGPNGTRVTNFKYGSQDYAYQPLIIRPNNDEVSRQRLGINASVQWKPVDGITATLDGSYLHLSNRDRYVSAGFHTGNLVNVLQPGATVSSNGAILAGTEILPRFYTHSENDLGRSHAVNGSASVAYDEGGPFTITSRFIAASASGRYNALATDNYATKAASVYRMGEGLQPANPRGLGTVGFGFDLTKDYPTVAFQNPDQVSDVSHYAIQSAYMSGNRTEADLYAGRIDATYKLDFGPFTALKAGFRLGRRTVDYTQVNYLSPIGGTGPSHLYFYKDSQITDPSYPTGVPGKNFSIVPRYYLSDLGNMVTSIKDFGPFKGVPSAGLPAINPAVMDNQLAFLNGLYPGNQAYTDPSTSYRISEKETSGYVQANLGGDILGVTYTGNVGVRLVNTDLTITNSTTNGANFIGVGGAYNGVLVSTGTAVAKRSYFNALPEFNVSFDVTSDSNLRFAANKAVARQNLSLLGAGFKSNYQVNATQRPDLPADLQLFLSGSSGNPDLKPFESNNYQGSYEWYFHKGSLLSAAVFYIDVKSFPLTQSTIEKIPDADGVVRSGGPVTRTVNGGGGNIKGLELSYQQQFDFLPGLLSGFGLNLNYTLSKSLTSNRDVTGQRLPLPDNSEHQVNAILLYQYSGLQARVAYNWRSRQYNSAFGIADSRGNSVDNLGLYTKPVAFLDASASYDVTPKVTVFVQGTNLTQSFVRQYVQWPELFQNESAFERRLTVGARARF